MTFLQMIDHCGHKGMQVEQLSLRRAVFVRPTRSDVFVRPTHARAIYQLMPWGWERVV